MTDMGALSREFDSFALEGSDERYVPWQRTPGRIDPDARAGLVTEFSRSATPERPITRLLTGHRGSGKTTELLRIASELRAGAAGRPIFVSTLRASEWLEVKDIRAEDIVVQIVRQLVSDLDREGVRLTKSRFAQMLQGTLEAVRGVRLESVGIGLSPLEFSLRRQDFPEDARDEFRRILRGQLPTLYDYVNNELLPDARQQLKAKGFEDLLVIVDELDRMPTNPDDPRSNQERIFLQESETLRGAIRCSLLITVPIDLAYSHATFRLADAYGAAVKSVPLVSIEHAGQAGPGERALIEIVGRRARKAFATTDTAEACAQRLFADEDLMLRVVRLSGGRVRGLLVMLRELLNWIDVLPIQPITVDHYVARTRKELRRPLRQRDHVILEQVRRDGQAVEDERFGVLLHYQYVFAYDTGTEERYALNPLLGESYP